MELTKVTIRGTDYIDMMGIQDALIFTPNFAGDPERTKYGTQMFSVRLDDNSVKFMKDNGIQVKEYTFKNTDEPETVQYVEVKIDLRHLDWYPVEVHLADPDGSNDYILPGNQFGKLDSIYDHDGFAKMDVEARVRKTNEFGDYRMYLHLGWFYQNINAFAMAHQRVVHPEEEEAVDELPFA